MQSELLELRHWLSGVEQKQEQQFKDLKNHMLHQIVYLEDTIRKREAEVIIDVKKLINTAIH